MASRSSAASAAASSKARGESAARGPVGSSAEGAATYGSTSSRAQGCGSAACRPGRVVSRHVQQEMQAAVQPAGLIPLQQGNGSKAEPATPTAVGNNQRPIPVSSRCRKDQWGMFKSSAMAHDPLGHSSTATHLQQHSSGGRQSATYVRCVLKARLRRVYGPKAISWHSTGGVL